MKAKTARKQVAYFLSPDLIREVKVEAARTDRDQSDVVAAALLAYLNGGSKPRPKAASA